MDNQLEIENQREMQRKLEIQAQKERDAEIQEEQLREQRLREQQIKLQTQQNARNVPIQYSNNNDSISTTSPLPPPRPMTPEEVKNNTFQFTNQPPPFQMPTPSRNLITNPQVFPPTSILPPINPLAGSHFPEMSTLFNN